MAFERLLEIGKRETAIDKTETMTTSWKDRQRRGILCGELNCLEVKNAEHPELFTACSSIRGTLFGRIKLFGGATRTVLDEPQ
ncbi:hypothetical protein BGX24_009270 [Mortierella sp. AD032]|nr:hypothetical protein BGX24_009270 [Mortierella sp. AD032]